MKLGRNEVGIVLFVANGKKAMTITAKRPIKNPKVEMQSREEKLKNLQNK
jgi:hypothetical protein